MLGYTRVQTFGKIILPQMIKRVLPPVTNEVITLVKDTSLASVIGTVEMFTRAKQIAVAPNSPGMMTFVACRGFLLHIQLSGGLYHAAAGKGAGLLPLRRDGNEYLTHGPMSASASVSWRC